MRYVGQFPEPYVEPASIHERILWYLGLILFCLAFWAALIGGVMLIGGWFK